MQIPYNAAGDYQSSDLSEENARRGILKQKPRGG